MTSAARRIDPPAAPLTLVRRIGPRGRRRSRIALMLLAMWVGCLHAAPLADEPGADAALLSAVVNSTSLDTDTGSEGPAVPRRRTVVAADAPNATPTAALSLGVGDAIKVQVYGRPELETTTYVGDDGQVTVPLAGPVAVLGQSPAAAGQSIAAAFRKGGFLLDPQVTVFMVQYRSQQVSVLGAVRTPGRFVIEAKTTLLDVLAQAGGIADSGASTVVLLRPDKAGRLRRYPVDLAGLGRKGAAMNSITLYGGDSIFVPPAPQFYITGEVSTPNMYRLEPGMTIAQAISRGGGITPRGSSGKVEIRRRKPDGSYSTRGGSLSDTVEADDVIRIRERLF